MKICTKCKEEKLEEKFIKDGKRKDGSQKHSSWCKECKKKYNADYYLDHQEKLKENSNNYRKENSEQIAIRKKPYSARYFQENKEKIYKYRNDRRKNNPSLRCQRIAYDLISRSLKFNNISKTDRTYKLLGYTNDDLRLYLESKFKDEYSWDTYGKGSNKWNVDHIIPVASFNLVNEDESLNIKELRKCNALSNLQPLWEEDNLKKGDTIVDGS